MALTDEQAAQMQADAENAWRVDQLPEDQQPPVDPATTSNPNFAKSKVVDVRLTASVHEALEQLAAQTGAAVSDVIRSAVNRYLHDAAREAEA
jgi:Ribbon-helix-helix protein, copG family